MTQRALVTGGAGFIGSHLVDALLAQGLEVTVLDDFSVGLIDNMRRAEATGRLRVVHGSVLDQELVNGEVEDCDLLFHLAVQCVRRSLGRPIESHDVNATGTLVVLEAARRRRVHRFIYCSSSEVYGDAADDPLNEDRTLCKPVTVYGAAKLAGELYADAYLRTYGLPIVIVRPFNAYGPRAYQRGTRAEVLPRFVNRIRNGLPPVIFGDGTNARDFTHVSEIARGILLAGTAERVVGERINIAYGQMVTIRELATTVLRILGRNDLAIQFMEARPGDVHQLHADTGKARELLGYKPEISLEEGVRNYLDWVGRHYPNPSSLLEHNVVNWELSARELE
jgi:UDP-glucose 4-epimerase